MIVKNIYSGVVTWEQAAFQSAEEIWERHNTYKDFSLKPFLDDNNTEVENLRNAINHYIKSDLYLQKIECGTTARVVNNPYGEHKFIWYAMASNAIKAIKKLYPKNQARMIEVVLTVINKQKDYGHHNIAMFGITGLVIRIHDKIARAENLMSKQNMENAVPNESIYDTFLDIIGYSIIAIMWLNGTFMYKLEENNENTNA